MNNDSRKKKKAWGKLKRRLQGKAQTQILGKRRKTSEGPGKSRLTPFRLFGPLKSR